MIVQDPEGREIDALAALLPLRPLDVVEIGCGDGRLTRRYAARARSVLAVDPDAGAIAEFSATPLPPGVVLRTSPIDRLDLPDRAADVVLLAWSL